MCEKFLPIWRSMHPCWLTEHIFSLFLAQEDMTNELKPCHEWIVQWRQDIFSYRQKVSVLGEFVKVFYTYADVYTDIELLNTSVVCS